MPSGAEDRIEVLLGLPEVSKSLIGLRVTIQRQSILMA